MTSSADIRNEKSTEEVFLEEKRKFCGLFIINNIKKKIEMFPQPVRLLSTLHSRFLETILLHLFGTQVLIPQRRLLCRRFGFT